MLLPGRDGRGKIILTFTCSQNPSFWIIYKIKLFFFKKRQTYKDGVDMRIDNSKTIGKLERKYAYNMRIILIIHVVIHI